jgi:hypothetical protein
MYVPLLVGFGVFLLVLILIGWAVERSAANDNKSQTH